MISIKQPAIETWRRLYQLAAQVKELAPWDWMEEIDIFGVKNPDTGQLGFVSVMGMAGEHYAVALYQGAEGLYGFWNFHHLAMYDPAPEMLLEIPELQLSYEDRKFTTDKDRALIKELGLKFRGRNAWTLFRCYRPGFHPWYLEADEAQFMIYALEQLLNVAPRYREDESLFEVRGENDYLVRVRDKQGNWKDKIMRIAPPKPMHIEILINTEALEYLKALPKNVQQFEMDVFMLPVKIGEAGERPSYAYMLMMSDSQTGMLLVTELLDPSETLEKMWGSVTGIIIEKMAMMNACPKKILVRPGLLAQLLVQLSAELKVELYLSPILPTLDPAKVALMRDFLGRW
jgi:hypothetical protein